MEDAMLALKPTSPDSPLAQQAALAAKALSAVARKRKSSTKRVALETKSDRETVRAEVPVEVFDFFVQVLSELAEGRAVTLIPQDQELTTQEVADILNVSRPYVVQLLENKKLPFRLVGTRRRVRFADVVDFKRRDDEGRRQVADELAREAEKAGLEY
jgi:excisionase family DNA binding protein